MNIKILFLTLIFYSFNLSSQTVIKTQSNNGKDKKVIVKTNKKNTKNIIVKGNKGYNYSSNNIIVKGNRDRVIIKKPKRPKKIKKRYNKKRRGYVWVKGHWKWFWNRVQYLEHIFGKDIDGYWIKKRRNHFWVDGYWIETEGGFFWVKGFWEKSF